jgi:UDP-3-O-[3-hydroxymyristoyl] glucosamine N-acyltransferase
MVISADVELGVDVIIKHRDLVNLYGCKVGSGTTIGPFVEIQKGCEIGEKCKISSHSFICEGVTIENKVFIRHGVIFTNDRFRGATSPLGTVKGEADWELEPTLVRRRASIGSNATVLPGSASVCRRWSALVPSSPRTCRTTPSASRTSVFRAFMASVPILPAMLRVC